MELLDLYEADCCAFDLENELKKLEDSQKQQNLWLMELDAFALCFRNQLDWYYLPDTSAGQNSSGLYSCPNFTGLTIQSMRTGYIHTFTLSGTCSAVSTTTVNGETRRYFITLNQYQPFETHMLENNTPLLVPVFYVLQGSSGPCNTVAGWLDSSGIYLSSSVTAPTGRYYGFSISIVLGIGGGPICHLSRTIL